MLPGVGTPPISLSISAFSAPMTAPHLKTVDCPAEILVEEALNDSMVGAAGQLLGVLTGVGPGTLMVTLSLVPKITPPLFRKRQSPLWVPGDCGAVIATDRSIVPPGAVVGTTNIVFVVMDSPFTKTNSSSLPQLHVPVFRTRQILSNACPGARTVRPGTVTSATNAELFTHVSGDAGVAVTT